MSDTNFYRTYPGNIACDKLKGIKEFRCPKCEVGQLKADSISTTAFTYQPSGIQKYTGSSPFGTVHTITSTELPVLSNLNCSGEITFYLDNSGTYVGLDMAIILKSKGVIQQSLIYQNSGNFTSVTLTNSQGNLVLTVNPGARCVWIYRGI